MQSRRDKSPKREFANALKGSETVVVSEQLQDAALRFGHTSQSSMEDLKKKVKVGSTSFFLQRQMTRTRNNSITKKSTNPEAYNKN